MSNLNNEPLGNYYEDRKKILFGYIDINKEEFYISQFLLNSQKKLNNEYIKITTGSSFFYDVPKAIHKFTLCLKENISNFCLIISLYLLNNKKEKSLEIYLLMCKQNKKMLELIYSKLLSYSHKPSTNSILFSPPISKMFIQILSCLIKLSGKFCKTTYQNYFCILYIKTNFILSLRNLPKITLISYKNELKYYRLYIYANCLFGTAIFNFYKYQPLSFSIYILQHILTIYQDINIKDNKLEQLLLLKVCYNLGLFFYVNGFNNKAINSLNLAKEKLNDIKLFQNNRNEEKDYLGRNSAVLNGKENILNKLTFYKRRINNIDNKNLEDIILSKFSQKNSNHNIVLNIIKEEISKDSSKDKKALYGTEDKSGVFFGVTKNVLKQTFSFEDITKKILLKIELLLTQIELNKKNYRGALEHINLILNNKKSKDDLENDLSKQKTFNIINKTYKNLKSFQVGRNKKYDINDKDNIRKLFDESMLTENDLKLIKLLLEKIEHDYNEHMHYDLSDSFASQKIDDNALFSSDKMKSMTFSNFKEMEKFFIFICNLSIYQLKILNQSQPKSTSFSKRNDLPILFTNQFKDCLTLSQRMALAELQTMCLSRYIILIDSEKEISPENLDYKYMKYRVKSSKENEEEKEFKIASEIKGRNINNKETNDSIIKSLSTNTFSINRTKKENEKEDESCIFEILLIKIKNENNKKFIESHKKSILNILNNLSEEDKKLFLNSPFLLEKMLEKVENKIKRNNNNNININEYSSYIENTSFSFISSQKMSNK